MVPSNLDFPRGVESLTQVVNIDKVYEVSFSFLFLKHVLRMLIVQAGRLLEEEKSPTPDRHVGRHGKKPSTAQVAH